MIHHAAWSSNNNIGILELNDLAFDRCASVNGTDMDTAGVVSKFFQFLAGLYRQFSGRAQQKDLRHAAIKIWVNHLDSRNAECGCFTGSGLGAANHIAPFQNQWDALRLNGGRFGKAHFSDSAQQFRNEGKFCK